MESRNRSRDPDLLSKAGPPPRVNEDEDCSARSVVRRRLPPVFGLSIVIALFAGFAWLTRNPDSELVHRARAWPLIGGWAEVFHRAYVPPPREEVGHDEAQSGRPATEYEIVWIGSDPRAEFEPRGAAPYVWVQPGSPIHADPEAESKVLHTTRALANLPILDREGGWYQVESRGRGDGLVTGWIRADDPVEPAPHSTPDPVLPLPANPIDETRLKVALDLMEGWGREYVCGDYRLVTDDATSSWLALCSELVGDLESVYAERYGLDPVSRAAETILFFSDREAYEAFRDQEQVRFESNVAHSYPARGYIAFYEGDRSPSQVISSLVHELTHLLNRRSLGPALPPWLAEGMADDLAESATDAIGQVSPGDLGGEAERLVSWTLRTGGIASLIRLQTLDQLDELPTLSELIAIEGSEFYGPQFAQNHYALSSFWIRFLLDDPDSELAVGFRSYLSAVAAGEAISEALLIRHLNREWAALEADFRRWLRVQSPDRVTPGRN